MIMVLLCQGLVFENDSENDPAVLLFGVVTVLILCLAISGSAVLLVKRKVQGDGRVFVSKYAFDMMTKDTKDEIYHVYSLELSQTHGLLEIQQQNLMEKLPTDQFQELQEINSKVYKLGTGDYEKFAATTRATSLSRAISASL
jgi:hypothetical protein